MRRAAAAEIVSRARNRWSEEGRRYGEGWLYLVAKRIKLRVALVYLDEMNNTT